MPLLGKGRLLWSRNPWNSASRTVHHDASRTYLDRLDRASSKEELRELYASSIRECGKAVDLVSGRSVHDHIVRSKNHGDRYLCNLLVEMYGKCGQSDRAQLVFHVTPQKNVYSWTILMTAFLSNGKCREAMQAFCEMDLEGTFPSLVTCIKAVEACSSLPQTRLLHWIVTSAGFNCNGILGNVFISLFARYGSLREAKLVFDAKQRDVVSWNAIIAAYAQNGEGRKALEIFQQMDVEPDRVTFISLVDACAGLEDLEQGRKVHQTILSRGVVMSSVLENALITLYGRCSSIDEARTLFAKMQQRDVVSWNAMLTAYAHNGHYKEVLETYKNMDMKPNHITFLVVLDSCASLSALVRGRSVHARLVADGYESNMVIGNCLVYMYARCGTVDNAKLVFDAMSKKDTISWTAMLAAYTQNGYPAHSMQLFLEMLLQGMKPDNVTLGCVLSACSYAGLVRVGRLWFVDANREFGLSPTAENYCSMVDLFSRAGWLKHAEDLIYNMPFLPHSVSWTMLLSACKLYGDVDRGQRVAEHGFDSDPLDHVPHVLLSNLYAAAGRWGDVDNARKRMESKGMKKEPGRSWIEIGDRIHEFVVGDKAHEQSAEIYAELDRLCRRITEAGYVPSTEEVLHDLQDGIKKQMLCYHSEKLAIAFGLISTEAGTTLRIMKNLRMCSDCHAAAKFMSKVVQRKIVVRDANRFHHINDGTCSCGDFW